VTISYDVTVSDGITSDTETLTFTITGTNDAPIIVVPDGLTGTVTERVDLSEFENGLPAHTITNVINFTDAELGQTHSSSVVPFNTVLGGPATVAPGAYLGTLSAGITNSAEDGAGQITWSFTVADGVLDHLRAGETIVQTYQVNVGDGTNSAIPQLITVTLVGTNDAPVITGYSAPMAVLENDDPITTNGTLTVTDVDVKDVVTARLSAMWPLPARVAWAP
jgi:VCBS repeat-containing protein